MLPSSAKIKKIKEK